MSKEQVGNLAITRKEGESILIGENVEVEVASLGKGKVRLIIRAPRSVKILRNELTREEKES